MKVLFFGAGPLGSFYAHLLHEKGGDVTVLARGERFDWIKENGLVLLNELTGQKSSSRVNVVNELKPRDVYDLVIVLIRKNKLIPVFEILAASSGVKNILFMGNTALGFDEYVKRLPVEKVLFGFHAKATRDEMEDLAREFQELTARTSVDTPCAFGERA